MTPHRAGAVWCDGRVVDAATPVFPAFGAVVRGEGVFETFAGARGGCPTLPLHVSRLRWAAGRLGCLPVPPIDFASVFGQLFEHSRLDRARCRIALFPAGSAPRLVCSVEPGPDLSTAQRDGLVLRTSPFRRGAEDPTPAIKSMSRAFYRCALGEAQAHGADEALLIGPGGEVLETTRHNVFLLVPGGELVTPTLNDGFLPGIARELLLRQVRAAGSRVRERTVRRAELEEAEEVFLTNAVVGALPVARIDAKDYPVPGRLAHWLRLLADAGLSVS